MTDKLEPNIHSVYSYKTELKSRSVVNSDGEEIIIDQDLVSFSIEYQFNHIPKNKVPELEKIIDKYQHELIDFEYGLKNELS